MDWKNQLTKTPYLVLFIILITVGVGTASALITITLDGNVVVTGDTTLQGDLTCTNCVDSADIADGSITSADLSIEPILGFYTIRDDSFIGDLTAPTRKNMRVFCDDGDVATGGGFRINNIGNLNDNISVYDSRPLGTFASESGLVGWSASFTLFNDVSDTFYVFVICADYAPAH